MSSSAPIQAAEIEWAKLSFSLTPSNEDDECMHALQPDSSLQEAADERPTCLEVRFR